ncbi:MAG: tRNA 2-thiouridine(34) synthase MnmA [Bacilli bacterium]|jgi:tRNA-specific 2-thiouridylase|nr:tRNA 2-thiouridine(34) synthase MnmA [Bacilli bacterium]
MKKVMVGVSGGVDSAVAILLLQKEGYQVEGLFMRNWDSSLNNDILGNPNDPLDVCPQEKDYLDAVEVAKKCHITLHRVDFVEEYWEKVFQYFLQEYKNNRTPNPDIMCNKEIKFKLFIDKALELGSDYIAMGHYARIVHSEKEDILLKGIDSNKDQSYFLSQLNQAQLHRVLFPIGHLTKAQVREIALQNDLSVAKKKDSTGVCFIGERHFKQFLQNYLPDNPGWMQTENGETVGKHDGLMYYTIGQRHGLGIGGEGDPWFVIGKDPKTNILLVGQGANHPTLLSNRCLVEQVNWLAEDFMGWKECSAKFRYRQKDIPVRIRRINDKLEAVYPQGAKAVTPGQAAVFYDGDRLIGGAIISEVFWNEEKRKY